MSVFFLSFLASLFCNYLVHASTNIDVRFEILERTLLQRISNLEGIVNEQKNEISNLKQEVATLQSQSNTNTVETMALRRILLGNKNTSIKSENQLLPNSEIEHDSNILRNVVESKKTEIRADIGLPITRSDNGNTIAFYSYMSASEPVQKHKTLIFNVIKSNFGNGYNNYTGAFVAPTSGVYVLTFTVHPNRNSEASVEVVVNNDVKGVVFTDGMSSGTHDLIASTAVVVVWMNQGDVSFVRTHATYNSAGSLYSTDLGRCSFAGWKISH